MLKKVRVFCVSGVCFLAVALWSGAVLANVAAFFTPTTLSGPDATTQTPLVVASETLKIRCEEVASRPVCRFEARYLIKNPTEATQAVVAAFYGARYGDRLSIEIDGAPVSRALTEAESQTLDGLVQSKRVQMTGSVYPNESDSRERVGFDMVVEAGRTRSLSVTSEPFEAGINEVGSYALAGVRSRHLLVGGDEEGHTHGFDYFLAPIRTWGGVGPIEIEVRTPERWRVSVEVSQDDRPFARSEESGEVVHSATLETLSGDSLWVRMGVPDPVFNRGGPVLGVGGAFGQEGGFRLRGGWELAAPGWLLWSASADTNFGDWLVATPMVEAVSDQVLIIPSFGLGLGVPVRILPDTEVGVRGHFSMVFGPLGFTFDVDFYPLQEEGDPVQITLMGLISF